MAPIGNIPTFPLWEKALASDWNQIPPLSPFLHCFPRFLNHHPLQGSHTEIRLKPESSSEADEQGKCQNQKVDKRIHQKKLNLWICVNTSWCLGVAQWPSDRSTTDSTCCPERYTIVTIVMLHQCNATLHTSAMLHHSNYCSQCNATLQLVHCIAFHILFRLSDLVEWGT